MHDLFLNDKDRLKEWARRRRYHRTSDILRWGVDNHSNRANRNKQLLVQEGFFRHIVGEEKERLFGLINEDAYECMEYQALSGKSEAA